MSTLPTRAEYLAGWSRVHGTQARSGLVRAWLGWTYRAARPLAAAKVPPDAVTLTGLALACAAVWPAAVGGRWPALSALLVGASAVCDGLDGATALLLRRASRWGALVDKVADRIGEAAFVVALYLLGAPGWLAALAAGFGFLLEYARAGAGETDPTPNRDPITITIAERPTRVIGAVMFLLACAAFPAAADLWATAGTAFGALVAAVGVTQLLLVVHRPERRR